MDNGIPNGLMDNRYSHIQIIFVNHEEEFEIAQGNIISGSSKYNSFFMVESLYGKVFIIVLQIYI